MFEPSEFVTLAAKRSIRSPAVLINRGSLSGFLGKIDSAGPHHDRFQNTHESLGKELGKALDLLDQASREDQLLAGDLRREIFEVKLFENQFRGWLAAAEYGANSAFHNSAEVSRIQLHDLPPSCSPHWKEVCRSAEPHGFSGVGFGGRGGG